MCTHAHTAQEKKERDSRLQPTDCWDPSEVSARAINELNRSLDKINELRDKVDSLYTELMGLDQDSTYQDNMMRDADTVDKVIAEVLSVLGSIRPAAMTTSADHTSATKPKPNSALKPFTLKRDDTPVVKHTAFTIT